MRRGILILGLIGVCGCASQNGDMRSQAQGERRFLQGLSDCFLGKYSPPVYSPADSVTTPVWER